MAFERNIIAIRWREGEYSVIERQVFNSLKDVDWDAVEKLDKWNDVATDAGYMDPTVVLSTQQMKDIARGPAAREFLDRTLKAGAYMYLVHKAELSGLD